MLVCNRSFIQLPAPRPVGSRPAGLIPQRDMDVGPLGEELNLFRFAKFGEKFQFSSDVGWDRFSSLRFSHFAFTSKEFVLQ